MTCLTPMSPGPSPRNSGLTLEREVESMNKTPFSTIPMNTESAVSALVEVLMAKAKLTMAND